MYGIMELELLKIRKIVKKRMMKDENFSAISKVFWQDKEVWDRHVGVGKEKYNEEGLL
jgi:hypothetical protein